MPSVDLNTKQLIFVGGLHRSGTSLLHKILGSHPDVSGFANTDAPEDEGQHLQSVYPPARAFGGPGKFGFDPASYMDETHPLVSVENAAKLLEQWSEYWDLSKPWLLEKSPPNLVRFRFLQALYPKAKFIVILRHPIAVSYATQKWSHTSFPSLFDHCLTCYEKFLVDLPFLKQVAVIRYEDFVLSPQATLDALLDWVGLERIEVDFEVNQSINEKYFDMLAERKRNPYRRLRLLYNMMGLRFESRANAFGYSLKQPDDLLSVDWIKAASPHSLDPAPG